MLLQLFACAQLLLPVLLLQPQERGRGFYLAWALLLAGAVWLLGRVSAPDSWQSLLAAGRSALLLLAATAAGAALARYVNRLWELVPVCLVMTLADFASWLVGPTASFSRQIDVYYRTLQGPVPLVDLLLVKLAVPGVESLQPVFGVSDWIMVVFFATVARRHGINDNLLDAAGESVADEGSFGRYLPVPVVALAAALLLAQLSGLFLPALPLIALVMLLWYALRALLRRRSA
jgi:hypothetical protein